MFAHFFRKTRALLPAAAATAAALAIAGAFAAPYARAGDCGAEVRLDGSAGSMARVPVLHQDGLDTCYAYAAAQLADALRHRTVRMLRARGEISESVAEQAYRHITSPLAAAVNTPRALEKGTINFGHAEQALNAIFKRGSCSHRALGDRFGAYDPKGFLTELKVYFDEMRARPYGTPISAPPAPLDCCLGREDAPLGRRRLEQYLQNTNFVAFLRDTFAAACRGQTIPAATGEILSFDGNRERNVGARRARFSDNLAHITQPSDLPVVVDFCADLLYDAEKTGVNAAGNWENCQVPHSSVAVGRRRGPGGTCQVLLRNSYGDSEKAYAWPKGGRGQIWVDEDALVRNMTGTLELK